MALAPPSTSASTTIRLETNHSNPNQLLETMSTQKKGDFIFNTHFENRDGFIQAIEPFDTHIHRGKKELGGNEKRQASIFVKKGGQRTPPFRMAQLQWHHRLGGNRMSVWKRRCGMRLRKVRSESHPRDRVRLGLCVPCDVALSIRQPKVKARGAVVVA